MKQICPTALLSQPLLSAVYLMWFALAGCVPASAVAAPLPDAGSLLQQNKPVPSTVPSSGSTGLQLDAQPRSSLPATAPFMVNRIEIDGNTVFDSVTLHALVADAEGVEQTLPQLGEVVYRITSYYHDHGYPLARAYVPAQTMRDGAVRVSVVEARYGQVLLTNHSLVSDEVLHGTLSVLKSGAQVEQSQLDRSLLLLSDIPGVVATSLIRPGELVGSSDLVVEAGPTPVWNGNAMLDNYGNQFTGRSRLSASVNWIDPLHLGDVLSIYALSAGPDMDNLSVNWESMIGAQGSRTGASISALHYRLGDSLAKIGGHGIAQVGSVWIKYPWQRSVEVNVYSQVQADYKRLDDDIDSTGVQTNRHISSATFSLNGDVRDAVLAGGLTVWSSAWKVGQLSFDNAAAEGVNAQSARTAGGFVKWNGSYTRLQNLTDNSALQLTLAVQWSGSNLDSAEKMVAGGPYSVRAYDMGVISGDSGVLGSIELHQNLGEFAAGAWQGIVFADSEHVTINQNPWAAGLNSATLSGAGVGLNWSGGGLWHARLTVAAPTGTVPALVNSGKKARAWIEIGTWF